MRLYWLITLILHLSPENFMGLNCDKIFKDARYALSACKMAEQSKGEIMPTDCAVFYPTFKSRKMPIPSNPDANNLEASILAFSQQHSGNPRIGCEIGAALAKARCAPFTHHDGVTEGICIDPK